MKIAQQADGAFVSADFSRLPDGSRNSPRREHVCARRWANRGFCRQRDNSQRGPGDKAHMPTGHHRVGLRPLFPSSPREQLHSHLFATV